MLCNTSYELLVLEHHLHTSFGHQLIKCVFQHGLSFALDVLLGRVVQVFDADHYILTASASAVMPSYFKSLWFLRKIGMSLFKEYQ